MVQTLFPLLQCLRLLIMIWILAANQDDFSMTDIIVTCSSLSVQFVTPLALALSGPLFGSCCLSTAQALASAPFSLPAPPAWVAHAKALQRIAVTNSVLLMRLAQLESEAAEAAVQQPNGEAAAGSTEPWRWRAHCDWSLSATFPVFHVTKQKTGAGAASAV